MHFWKCKCYYSSYQLQTAISGALVSAACFAGLTCGGRASDNAFAGIRISERFVSVASTSSS